MAIRIRSWHALVALVLLVVCGVGLGIGAQRDGAQEETRPLDLSLPACAGRLPTSAVQPTPTAGWWDALTFPTSAVTATITPTTTPAAPSIAPTRLPVAAPPSGTERR